jgi:hypothetical protein
MAARRKVRRTRKSKVFSISAIEGGAALSLLSSTGAAQGAQQMLKGDIVAGVDTISRTIQSNKSKILGTLGAAAIGKFAAKSFSVGRVAKLGPIAVKL